jgi:hypothetical protein
LEDKMTSQIQPLSNFLELPPVSRLRRNHGLEHATLHILAQRRPGRSLAGYSDLRGIWILGDIETADLEAAVNEALLRLSTGESQLAVHPFCGTNMVTTGVLAGGAAALAMFGAGPRFRDKLERLPLAISLATLGLILGQPLGMTLQKQVTTSGVPGSLHIVRIIPQPRGRIMAHRIVTAG